MIFLRSAPGRRVARVVAIATTMAAAISGLGVGAAQAAGPPVGKTLNCYSTYASSGAASGYVTNFQASLLLSRHGSIRYQVTSGGIIRNTVPDHVSWTSSHGKLHFRHGFFDNGGKVVGRVSSAGATMPHSQLTPARYTVVLRSSGTPANDAMPPSSEGTDFRQASYWYCTTSKPTSAPTSPAATPTPNPAATPTPTPDPVVNPTPVPTPVPTGPHPPYGTYSCVDRYGYPTSKFSLADPFTYHEQNTASGAFTFDSAASRVDFQGGQYDNEAIHWHFVGTYTAPGTIVLAAKVQGSYGGPDVDEVGAHTLWHCSLA